MSTSTSGAFAARPGSIWLMRSSSSSRDWSNVPLAGAGVFGKRANQPVVRQLLHDMRRPAGNARHHKKRREHVDVEAHHVIGGAGRKIEVGMNFLLLEHDGFENV